LPGGVSRAGSRVRGRCRSCGLRSRARSRGGRAGAGVEEALEEVAVEAARTPGASTDSTCMSACGLGVSSPDGTYSLWHWKEKICLSIGSR
jgi:hypothetical protein